VRERPDQQETAGETPEQWTYTRGVILRVLSRFPDALEAIREALIACQRPCPKELHEPG
jgi:hypothetical protein